ncbi:MAG: SMP-30/gluconolactonase/LRE family protein [Candidatus Limnocylindria bacterium]|nr:SMP-30/gluconolactonase/LRE family protein [Candidatus Limnocylindria bacterium]
MSEFAVGAGQGPHDVAPAADGGVWYTAQRTGELGYLDPTTGATRMVKLGAGSAPHGVIVGPDGAPWITDSGSNAIVRVDPKTNEVKRYPLPADRPNDDLNTATFDADGTLWFTGQSGVFGRLDPKSGTMAVFDAARGRGPYGIATCPDGTLYYASLAGSYVGRIGRMTGGSEILVPPTAGQGARRVWCDSKSRVWVSAWNTGQLARLDGTTWKEWKLPGTNPMAYAVYVDDADIVWITDWGANAIVRFDPATETFTSLPHSAPNGAVRQLLGRPGEVWGAASGQDKLLVVRTR